MRKFSWGAIAIVMFLGGVAVLSGCGTNSHAVSTAHETSNMTLSEQRAWVAEQFDMAVSASDVFEGWVWGGGKIEPMWTTQLDEDRDLVLESLTPGGCGGYGGRLDASLQNNTARDPLQATARVRAFWEQQGVPVRDLYDTHHDTEPYFIVDFEDGGSFSMLADARGMAIAVHTSCSVNNTVTNWIAYLDEGGDPFAEEFVVRDDGIGSGSGP